MACRVQVIADRGYSATKPRPIQFVLAGRNADTTAEADVSATDKYGTCIENPPIQYIRVKGQVYKRHTYVSDGRGRDTLPFQGREAFAFALPRPRDVFSCFA